MFGFRADESLRLDCNIHRVHVGIKGTSLGTRDRELQEYSRNVIGAYLPRSLYSIIFLLYSWGSLFGVPNSIEFRLSVQGLGFKV